MAFHSIGGWKASLFGDHHMQGMVSIRFYTNLKTITSSWPTGIRAGAEPQPSTSVAISQLI
jgi:malonate-semialdehyde dehydrogenase (acetylating) / methylmalonate-semialdehyde dehydrogenase